MPAPILVFGPGNIFLPLDSLGRRRRFLRIDRFRRRLMHDNGLRNQSRVRFGWSIVCRRIWRRRVAGIDVTRLRVARLSVPWLFITLPIRGLVIVVRRSSVSRRVIRRRAVVRRIVRATGHSGAGNEPAIDGRGVRCRLRVAVACPSNGGYDSYSCKGRRNKSVPQIHLFTSLDPVRCSALFVPIWPRRCFQHIVWRPGGHNL